MRVRSDLREEMDYSSFLLLFTEEDERREKRVVVERRLLSRNIQSYVDFLLAVDVQVEDSLSLLLTSYNLCKTRAKNMQNRYCFPAKKSGLLPQAKN
jgi:hypothetical protein